MNPELSSQAASPNDSPSALHGSAARERHARASGRLVQHPDDASARLLIAEALVKDEAGDSGERVQLAIGHLREIEDAAAGTLGTSERYPRAYSNIGVER